MKSTVVKRSIVVGGHKTSVSLEEPFWTSMKEISQQLRVTLSELVSEIDTNRQQSNLSSAIRLFVLDHFKSCGSAGSSAPETKFFSRPSYRT
jgi:predicted DNA-binding ribbon-helix-helix protein